MQIQKKLLKVKVQEYLMCLNIDAYSIAIF